jgi:hypothetical protein
MADIAKINGLNLKDAAARADIATAKTDIAGLKESVIKEISSSYIRITDYPTGVYKLTYNGTKYIYYNGATSTSTVDVKGSSGAVILTVNRYSTSRWSWSYINTDVNGVMYLGYGQTNTSSGTRNVMTLPSDVTGTLATTALATTSTSGLMSSTDKNTFNTMKDQMQSALRVASNSTTASNGYINLTNTKGTRLQLRWGYATPSNGKIAVNFASPFSSTCLAVIGCAINAQPTTTLLSFKASAKSATGFTAYCSYTNSAGAVAYADEIFCWFAIGY